MTHEQIIENDMLIAQNSLDMTKYNRIIPECFIEIYGNNIGDVNYTDFISINHLERYLKFTKNIGLKTIAIFKIKIK